MTERPEPRIAAQYGFEPIFEEHKSPSSEQTEIDRRYLELRAQLLDRNGLRDIPKPTPLIENWLFKDSLAWIQGKWGNGKSFLAVDIACSVATGIEWHGNTVTQGVVLYLIAEGASGLDPRVEAWEASQAKDATGIVFLPSPVQLGKTSHIDVAAFRMLLKTIQPVLVILDTQARVTVGAEENSSKDMGVFVDVLETLRRECSSTMLVVHHEPRNGENLRGSVALEGAAESIIRTAKEGDNINVSCLKQKNIPEPDDLRLTLYPIGKSAALFTDVPGTHNALGPNEEKILEVLTEFPDARAASTQLLEASGPHKGSFYRSRNKLLKKGRIFQTQEGNSTIYRIPNQDLPDHDTPGGTP
jgi:hypothetical protein